MQVVLLRYNTVPHESTCYHLLRSARTWSLVTGPVKRVTVSLEEESTLSPHASGAIITVSSGNVGLAPQMSIRRPNTTVCGKPLLLGVGRSLHWQRRLIRVRAQHPYKPSGFPTYPIHLKGPILSQSMPHFNNNTLQSWEIQRVVIQLVTEWNSGFDFQQSQPTFSETWGLL